MALDPRSHRRESKIPARRVVAAQAGRCRDAAGDWGNGVSRPFSRRHHAVASRASVVSRELGTSGQETAGVSLRAAGAVGGAGPGSPGARYREETRLSGGLELERAPTVKRLCLRFASEHPGKHDSGSRQIEF